MRLKANLLTIVTLFVATAMVAISCEKDDVGVIPNAKEIECSAGDRPTISFSAGGDWSLSSDAVWCQFITSGGELQEMSGPAGSHTITLKITDDNNGTNWSTANITMKMGANRGIIATIKRHPSELYMRLYDVTDTPKKEIELAYIDWIPFRLEANFRFAATSIPEWVEIGYKDENGDMYTDHSIVGVPGEQTEAYARIVNNGERERYKIEVEDGYVITFSDESGDNTFEFPIIYKGMGSDKISFEGPTSQTYGWEVSLDGTKFRQTNSIDGNTVTFDNELEFSIAAQDDSYKVIRIDQNIERGIPSHKIYQEDGSHCWIGCKRKEGDQSLLSITIEPSETVRHGIVMVVPMAIWNKIRGDIGSFIFDTDDSSGVELPVIHEDYQQYVIMEFSQRNFEQSEYEGMYIYHSITALEIYAAPYTNTAIMEQYGVGEGMAYQCDFVNSVEGKRPGIIIDPRTEGWTTPNYEGGNATAEVFYKGEKLKLSEGEYYIGENKDEILALHLWGPNAGFTENVYIVFKVGGVARKLLVVTPPAK